MVAGRQTFPHQKCQTVSSSPGGGPLPSLPLRSLIRSRNSSPAEPSGAKSSPPSSPPPNPTLASLSCAGGRLFHVLPASCIGTGGRRACNPRRLLLRDRGTGPPAAWGLASRLTSHVVAERPSPSDRPHPDHANRQPLYFTFPINLKSWTAHIVIIVFW
ncbi:hypothetical protein LY76DRAFT_305031 [Colletotrichum caudatum]|nr:hypothetical protein LY76DRAFT_305031 [Colletotrichum caudatum]